MTRDRNEDFKNDYKPKDIDGNTLGGVYLRENLRKAFVRLLSNNKLMRLLHYNVDNPEQNPLNSDDPKYKDEVYQLEGYNDILKNILVLGDKTNDLSLETVLRRICLYAGGRSPYKDLSNVTGLMTPNMLVSRQMYVVDVYSDIPTHNIDLRLDWLGEEVINSLQGYNLDQYTKLIFREGAPIFNTPTNYMGYRWIFELTMSQEGNNDGYK